jgi:hypothetical protein
MEQPRKTSDASDRNSLKCLFIAIANHIRPRLGHVILLMDVNFDDWLSTPNLSDDFFSYDYFSGWGMDDPFTSSLPSVPPPPHLPEPEPPLEPPRLSARRFRKRMAEGDDEVKIVSPKEVEARHPIPEQARSEMNEWILANIANPFLTKDQEDYFATKYGITRRQVKVAFNNRRQRIVAPVRRKMEEVQRNAQQQLLLHFAQQGIFVPFVLPFPFSDPPQ